MTTSYAPAHQAFDLEHRKPSPQKLVSDAVRGLHVECLGVDENNVLVFRRTKDASDAPKLLKKIADRITGSSEIRQALQGVDGIALI